MSDVVRRKLLDADHPIGIKKKCPYPLPPWTTSMVFHTKWTKKV